MGLDWSYYLMNTYVYTDVCIGSFGASVECVRHSAAGGWLGSLIAPYPLHPYGILFMVGLPVCCPLTPGVFLV